jgi:hypothetical protein
MEKVASLKDAGARADLKDVLDFFVSSRVMYNLITFKNFENTFVFQEVELLKHLQKVSAAGRQPTRRPTTSNC